MVTDSLDAKKIEAFLDTECPVEVLRSVDSTNLYIKRKAAENSGVCAVIADSQTVGRGRFERKFYSPDGCGIYMSILLHPHLPAEASVLLTAAAAVAVCEAVEAFTEYHTEIKWVNDILVNSKKVCGILAEASFNPKSGRTESAVVGIGINVYKPKNGFAGEIKDIAGYISEEYKPDLRNMLCAKIISRMISLSDSLEERSFLPEYKRRSAVLGKTVTVLSGNEEPAEALALELDDNCRLLVEYKDKTREYINSGEISIRPHYR